MSRDFNQIVWNEQLADDVRKLIALAISEDFGTLGDITTRALVPENVSGEAVMRARQNGVVAGLVAVPTIIDLIDPQLHWEATARDGEVIDVTNHQMVLGKLSGPVASILVVERMILNLVGRLSGIATLTKCYVNNVEGTKARIYDTRKTTLGWRRLEKYAVKCGGGMTHRTGLFDAVLIKDNHLAYGAIGQTATNGGYTPALAVRKARKWVNSLLQESVKQGQQIEQIAPMKTFRSCGIQVALKDSVPKKYKSCGIDIAQKTDIFPHLPLETPLIEIEVDTIEQLKEVLPEGPDIVLLDNMSPDMLRHAVALRDQSGVATELEASGGINLNTVRAIAETGVDRISVGGLTHSAVSLDMGLDF